MEEHKVAVIVYSQARTEPTVGLYDRGGIGKLGMMCVAIIKDATSTELEKVAPRPVPIVVTPKEWAEATRSAQLLASKVNGLEGENADECRVDSVQLKKGERPTAKAQRLQSKDPNYQLATIH